MTHSRKWVKPLFLILQASIRRRIVVSMVMGVFLVELLVNGLYYAMDRHLLIRQVEQQHRLLVTEFSQEISDLAASNSHVPVLTRAMVKLATEEIGSKLSRRLSEVTRPQLDHLVHMFGIGGLALLRVSDKRFTVAISSDKTFAIQLTVEQRLSFIRHIGNHRPYVSQTYQTSSRLGVSGRLVTYYYQGHGDTIMASVVSSIRTSPTSSSIAKSLITNDPNLLAVISYTSKDAKNASTVEGGVLLAGKVPIQTRDILTVQNVLRTHQTVSYIDRVTGHSVLKTFVPGASSNRIKHVLEFVTDFETSVQVLLNQHLRNAMLVSATLLLLSALVGYVLGNQFVNPLAELRKRIQDFSSQMQPENPRVDRRDEIGELAREVDGMSQRITREWQRIVNDERSSGIKYLGMIAHILIHELRSPMSASMNLIELFPHKDDLNHDQLEVYRHLSASVEHMNNLLSDFAEFIRHGTPLEFGLYDIVDVIHSAIDVVTPLADPMGIKVISKIQPGSYTGRIDPGKLKMVIVNLLKNGLDAMATAEHRDELLISVTQVSHFIAIDVTDHGSGIPEERWIDIFMPFQSSKETGFGVGLSLSAVIVIGMGGNIFVSDSSIKGTTMRVLIPTVEVSGTRNRYFTDDARLEQQRSKMAH